MVNSKGIVSLPECLFSFNCVNDMLMACSEHRPSTKPLISPCKAFLCSGYRLALDHKRKAPKGAYKRVKR
jgi:hypothetical protein